MSHHSHEVSVPAVEDFDPKDAGGLPMILLGVGVIGSLGSFLGFLVGDWRAQAAHSYLFGFAYFFTISVGCLFWTCLHHATDSDWSVVVRRQLENVAGLIPYLAILFLPLLFVADYLWEWWPLKVGDNPVFDAKQPYLSHWFFLVRFALYFSILGTVAWNLKSRSTAQDRDGAARHSFVMRKFGVGGIPAVALCLTFAAFDWLMSLDYQWYSTMWGVYIFAGAAGSSMSLLVLVVTALKNRGYLNVVTLEHYHIMGKYMLAFVIFWAYIGFSQYMLIWYANVPEETIYFQIRNTGGWHFLSTLLVVGRFFLPFPVLLLQWVKKKPRYLCMVAGWILFMQFIDLYVIVLPALHGTGVAPSIFDILSFAGVGGILGWIFFRHLGGTHLFPTRDPRLAASLKLTN
jgi:hypothetical protein